jgi:ribonucleoside-diphosphate reductase alpha chain
LGIMGFQNALFKLRIPYGSQNAVEFADYVHEHISYYAISASVDLAEQRGTYPSFEGSLWSKGILPIDSIEFLAESRCGHLDMKAETTLDWNSLRTRVKTKGMRNSNSMAIAPTATISNIVGTSQSIEPVYQNLFVKSNLSGEFTIVNKYLVDDLKALDLWNDSMLVDLKYFGGSVSHIKRIPKDLKDLYATAFEIDTEWLIKAAARRQKWIDQSQSLNIYLKEPSGKKLDSLYRAAWFLGLKTTYYLRTLGATRVQPSTVNPIKTSCDMHSPDCDSCQ